MYKRIFRSAITFLLCIILIGGFVLFYQNNMMDKFMSLITSSDKYNSEYFGKYYHEYTQWEYEMIKENPDYENPKILVDISVKTLYLLNDNELIKTYPIASGKPGTPSPLGSWEIVSKARWGGGFGTRWMGLNVPWGNCQEEHLWGSPLPLENRG